LTAAIYAARAKLHTVVVDEGLIGGQVATTFQVANYPGTNGVVRGVDLMENMKKQALDFGAYIDDLKEISDVNLEGKEKLVTAKDTDYYAKAVLIATGATPRRLPVKVKKSLEEEVCIIVPHATVPCTLMPTFLWWEEESPRRKKLFF